MKTSKYEIKVKQKVSNKNEVQLYKQQNIEQNNKQVNTKEVIKVIKTTDNQKLLYFFFGFVSATLMFCLTLYVIKVKAKNHLEELPLEKEIKKTKTKGDLLKVLLPYISIDKNLDDMIFALEYKNNLDFNQIKKDIIEIVKVKKIKT